MTIAGVPLHISQAFLAVVLLLGFFAGSQVADTRLVRIPTFESTEEALRAFEPGGAFETIDMEITPGLGWAVAAGLGVAAIYALSVVAHELGHLLAARRAGVHVAAMHLHAAGGYVELDDDDSLTAGKLAAIVAAGPLVTAALALVAALVLVELGVADGRDAHRGLRRRGRGGSRAVGRVRHEPRRAADQPPPAPRARWRAAPAGRAPVARTLRSAAAGAAPWGWLESRVWLAHLAAATTTRDRHTVPSISPEGHA